MPSSSSSSANCYDAAGRQGIGVVQPQSGTDFPLCDVPSDDIRYLLADAFLSYEDVADYSSTLCPLQPPFRIAWLHGLGTLATAQPAGHSTPTHAVDLTIVDANNCLVFDSTTATRFYTRQWGERLAIYGWETDNAHFYLVVHTCWGETADPELSPREYAVNITPASAVLDERCVERLPRRVRSLRVLTTDILKLPVNLRGGYNMTLSHEGEFKRGNGLRLSQRINFDATPGSGDGIYPGCEPTVPTLTRINNVPPDEHGNFHLAANQCYFVRQPSEIVVSSPRQATVTPAMLQMGNNCSPCCSCEDYVATADYMNATRNRYKTVGQMLEATRDQYHENRRRWLASKCCFERFPLRLVVQPQMCPFLDVGAQFCNLSDHCVGPLELNIHVEIFGGSAVSGASLISLTSGSSACVNPMSEEVPGFTFSRGQSYKSPRRTSVVDRYALGGAHPDYTAFWDAVEAAQSVWVRFRLRFDCCGVTPDGDPLFVKLTLTGKVGDPVGAPLEDILIAPCGSSASSASYELAMAKDEALLRCPREPADTFDPVCEDGCA